MNKENAYKLWLIQTIILTVITFIFFTLFNTLCSYRNEKTTKIILEKAAQTLLNGHMIAGLGDDKAYDDRLLQKLIIQNFKKIPDIALFGSSRSMPIRTESLKIPKSKKFFNHALASAGLEDTIALVGIYQVLHNKIPSTIILSIDPWIFNEKTFCEKWKSNCSFYQTIAQQILKKPEKPNLKDIQKKYDYWRLISFSYTVQNLQTLGKSPLEFFVPTDTNYNEFIRDTDGSIHWPTKIKQQSGITTQEIITKSINNHATECARENITKLSHTDLFEAFISFLLKQNSRVIFYLPPYHPDLYRFFERTPEYSGVLNVEKYLKKFASKTTITVLGSYNPQEYNLTNEDFFDGIHGHDSLVQKVLGSIALNRNLLVHDNRP